MPGREPRTEMQTIAGYRVPVYLVESYARATATCGALFEHQKIFDYLAKHYKLVAEYCDSDFPHQTHMHLEIAQRIIDGEFEHMNKFLSIAKFAVGLDEAVQEVWRKEQISHRMNWKKI